MSDLEVERNYIRDSFKEPITNGVYRTKPRSGKGSMGSDYFEAHQPGEKFFKEIVPGNTPINSGIYLVFYKYEPPSAWSSVEKAAGHGTGLWDGDNWQGLRIAGMTIANYQNQRWGLNATVLAYIGPLPTLSLDALLDYTPGFPINQTFYISTMKMASKGMVSSGPHAEYIHASLTGGFFGEYIFKKTNQDSHLIPISRFDPDHKAAVKWKRLSEKEQKDVLKNIEELIE